MFNKMLPHRIDNTYRGHKLALWLFALVVLVKTLQSLMVIFNGDSIVRSADGIPLDTYTPAGAQTVLAIWALLGLERLIIFLLCVLVLVRYRSAVSFMLALLALEYLARQLVLYFVPLVRTGTPVGPVVNLVLFCLTVVGFALSLWKKDRDSAIRLEGS